MAKNAKLSKAKKILLEVLLQDPLLADIFKINNIRPKSFSVKDDGSVYIGKSSSPWKNLFFRETQRFSFTEVVNKIYHNFRRRLNEEYKTLFKEEVVKNLFDEENHDLIVDMLFDLSRYGMNDGFYTSEYFKKNIKESYTVTNTIECSLGQIAILDKTIKV